MPKDVLQTIFNATVAAMKTPETAETFKKQTFNIVPNASLADAKTWLGAADGHLAQDHQRSEDRDGVKQGTSWPDLSRPSTRLNENAGVDISR